MSEGIWARVSRRVGEALGGAVSVVGQKLGGATKTAGETLDPMRMKEEVAATIKDISNLRHLP